MKIDVFFFSLSLCRETPASLAAQEGCTRCRSDALHPAPGESAPCFTVHSESHTFGAVKGEILAAVLWTLLISLMFCSFLVLFKLKLETCKCKCKISSTWFRVMYYWKILLYNLFCCVYFCHCFNLLVLQTLIQFCPFF